MADPLENRVARLEESMVRAFTAIEALADKEAKLDETMVTLTEAHIELAKSQKELAKSQKETDARIQALVSAIGELLRKNGKS